jgi:hypothetical protein
MAEITRNVGDVSPTNFIKPGVRDDSTAQLIEGAGTIGLAVDEMLATRRLAKGIDAATAQYMVSSPAAAALQDGAADENRAPSVQLSEEEVKDLNDFDRIRATTLNAVDQGRMTHAQYKLIVDRQLRMAIARRPGLANEFRNVAGFFSGTAAVDILAAAEADMGKKDAESTRAMVAYHRTMLQAIGRSDLAGLPDEQVTAAFWDNQPDILKVAQTQANAGLIGEQRKLFEDGAVLRGPEATTAFYAEVDAVKTGLMRTFNEIFANGSLAAAGEEDTGAAVHQVQMAIDNEKLRLAQLGGASHIDNTVIERSLGFLDSIQAGVTDIMTGTTDLQTRKNRLERYMVQIKDSMLTSNRDFAVTVATADLVGDSLMAQFYNKNQEFQSITFNSFIAAVQGEGSPAHNASLGGQYVSAVVGAAADSAAPWTDEQVAKAIPALVTAANAYVLTPDNQYKAEWFAGSNGFAHKMALHAKKLSRIVAPEQKETLTQGIAAAAYNHQRMVAGGLFQKLPALKDRVGVMIKEDGTLIQKLDGVEYTGAESDMIRQANALFGGRNILTAMTDLSGIEKTDALRLIYGARTAVERARSAPAAPKARSASTGRTAPSSPYPDGTILEGPGGAEYVVQNGVPVKR